MKLLPGNDDIWYGFNRRIFDFEGHEAWIVQPEHALPNHAWNWCPEWPNAFVERCGALELLNKGFHHVHVNIFGTYANCEGLAVMDRFYQRLQQLGFAKKATLTGLSMGGLYSYRFATEYPERVAAVYADAPVCDLAKYPEIRRKEVFAAYGLDSMEEAEISPLNPINRLERLAHAGVPLLHVVGLADEVVKVEEHTDILEARYRALGGSIEVLRRPCVGHHPHGWDDPAYAADFLADSVNGSNVISL